MDLEDLLVDYMPSPPYSLGTIESENDEENNLSDDGDEVHSRELLKLSDLAAVACGKHCSWAEVDQYMRFESDKYTNRLEEFQLLKIQRFSFPQEQEKVKTFILLNNKKDIWNDGVALSESSNFLQIQQVGFMVTSHLTKTAGDTNGDISRVSLTFEKQNLVSCTCSSCTKVDWCKHVVATIIYRIKNQTNVSLIYMYVNFIGGRPGSETLHRCGFYATRFIIISGVSTFEF